MVTIACQAFAQIISNMEFRQEPSGMEIKVFLFIFEGFRKRFENHLSELQVLYKHHFGILASTESLTGRTCIVTVVNAGLDIGHSWGRLTEGSTVRQ